MRSVPSAPESAPKTQAIAPLIAVDLWARIRLAQSILAHREPSFETTQSALAALAGYSIEQIVNREYPRGAV